MLNGKINFYQTGLSALADAPVRILVSAGESYDALCREGVPDNCTLMRTVPQTGVLQSAAVFITHCGMNSVNESIFHGVPMVLGPQHGEQAMVAQRACDLGLGIYVKHMTPKAIKEAVEHILGTDAYLKAVQELSQRFQSCGGAIAAADWVEAVINK